MMQVKVNDWVKYSTLHGELKVFEVLFVSPDGTYLEGAETGCLAAKVIEVRRAAVPSA